MSNKEQERAKLGIVPGLQVYDAASEPAGTVEEVVGDHFRIGTQLISFSEIARVESYGIYLNGVATQLLQRSNPALAAKEAKEGAATVAPITEQAQVQAGVPVVGLDEVKLGAVGEVHADSFVLNRLLHRGRVVPFSAVMEASDTKVVLNIRGHELDKMHWPFTKVLEDNEFPAGHGSSQ